jgi:hypothetical protein
MMLVREEQYYYQCNAQTGIRMSDAILDKSNDLFDLNPNKPKNIDLDLAIKNAKMRQNMIEGFLKSSIGRKTIISEALLNFANDNSTSIESYIQQAIENKVSYLKKCFPIRHYLPLSNKN